MSLHFKVYGDIFDQLDYFERRLIKLLNGPLKLGDEVVLIHHRIDIKNNILYFWQEEGCDPFTYRIVKIYKNNMVELKTFAGFLQLAKSSQCYPVGSPCRTRMTFLQQ